MRLRECLFLLPLLAGCERSAADWGAELKSPKPSTRLHAVNALGARANAAAVAVPLLTEALGDEDTFVRRDAAAALGGFGDAARDAVPALQGLLEDREPGVRKAAAAALAKIDPSAKPAKRQR